MKNLFKLEDFKGAFEDFSDREIAMDSRVDDLILNLNRLAEASSLPKWFVSTCITYGSPLLWE